MWTIEVVFIINLPPKRDNNEEHRFIASGDIVKQCPEIRSRVTLGDLLSLIDPSLIILYTLEQWF